MNLSFFQAMEQLQAHLRDLSPVLFSYYVNLHKAGFTEEQAMELVRDFHAIILTKK